MVITTNIAEKKIILPASKMKPLGRILEEAQLISSKQIDIARIEQMRFNHMRIGEILASKGWINQQTADFFAEQWLNLLQATEKKPLGYYLKAAGLLNEEQIKILLQEQQQITTTIRLGKLAVIRGLIKQHTVDFFLKNLFLEHNPNQLLLNSTYEILKYYTQGKRNFKGLRLHQIKLNGLIIKNSNFDYSDLADSQLQNSNFSGSSFSMANLEKANCYKSIFIKTSFLNSSLKAANFQHTYFKKANFWAADLREVDFSEALLIECNFSGANLQGANFTRSLLNNSFYNRNTIFDSDFNPKRVGMIFINK